MELNTTLTGIILDSDVIIELYNSQNLDSILEKLFQEGTAVYIPKDICIIDNFHDEVKNKVTEYITSELLKELSIDTSSEIYNNLKKLPFDEGELHVYSLADEHKLLVISNDKIAAYSYLVYKNHNSLKFKEISSDELLENYYAENENLITRRMSNYNFLQSLGYELSDINQITKSKRRDIEWFQAKDIAKENKKLLKMFSSEKSFYLSIGSIAASVYALDKTTDSSRFQIDKHYKMNVGLKIKSTSKSIQNKLFTRKVQSTPYNYWEYNNIAYNAIIKYMKHSKFLIPLLNESMNCQYIGLLTEEEHRRCMSFTEKFRNLFDKYRETV